MRLLRAVWAVVLVMMTTGAASAGYDKTSWGMSVGEVQRLFPDGVVRAEPDGTTKYMARRKIAGTPALAQFDFERGKLVDVHVLFAVEFDRAMDTAKAFTAEEAADVFNRAKEMLTEQYGKPVHAERSKDVVWMTSVDLVALVKIFRPEDPRPRQWTVGIEYRQNDR